MYSNMNAIYYLHTTGDYGSPPFARRRGTSPGKVALWSSGYEPQEGDQSDISLFRRSPHQ